MEFEIGKLYMNAAGFIYEVVTHKGDEIELMCWNPNDPRNYRLVSTHFVYSTLALTLDEVNYDYLESVIRMQKDSVRYHMREAQQKRNSNIRFETELKRHGTR